MGENLKQNNTFSCKAEEHPSLSKRKLKMTKENRLKSKLDTKRAELNTKQPDVLKYHSDSIFTWD